MKVLLRARVTFSLPIWPRNELPSGIGRHEADFPSSNTPKTLATMSE